MPTCVPRRQEVLLAPCNVQERSTSVRPNLCAQGSYKAPAHDTTILPRHITSILLPSLPAPLPVPCPFAPRMSPTRPGRGQVSAPSKRTKQLVAMSIGPHIGWGEPLSRCCRDGNLDLDITLAVGMLPRWRQASGGARVRPLEIAISKSARTRDCNLVPPSAALSRATPLWSSVGCPAVRTATPLADGLLARHG